MSATLEQSRAQQLQAAAELAPPGDRPDVERLLHLVYRHVAVEDLLARRPADLLGAALSERDLARDRAVGTANIAVTDPEEDGDGWGSAHTVVQVVTDDMPFLVDSVTGALDTLGHPVSLVVHPQLVVRRDAAGRLEEILGDDGPHGQFGVGTESWMLVEIDRVESAENRDAIVERLRTVLGNVRDAVEDWARMRTRCAQVASGLRTEPPAGIGGQEVAVTANFLDWLAADHFTFLGYREYVLAQDAHGEDVLDAVPGSGLGILRYDRPHAEPFARLNPSAHAKALEPELLIVTKANTRATVHRSTYLDYVGVKTFDASGAVVGERRFLGLLTSSAYAESILTIPILRERVAALLAEAGYSPDSHSGKDVVQVLETYPRDELLQTDPADLLDIVTTVLHLQERRKTRLFLRRDLYGRFVSALVYLPRDRYTTAVRLKMEDILRRAFDASSVEATTRVSESALARVHFTVRVPRGHEIPDLDPQAEEALQRAIVDATRTWDEDLAEQLRSGMGDEAGARLVGLYGRAFPEAYKQDVDPLTAVADIRRIELLEGEDDIEVDVHGSDGDGASRRFTLFGRGSLTLTRILPLFGDLGVEVIDERPYEIRRSDGVRVYAYDFGLRAADAAAWSGETGPDARRLLFQNAVRAVWTGAAESDGFNALVLAAGLTWRQVVVLRMAAKYLRQTRSTFSQDYVEAALVANPRIAALLVELFETRFDPERYAGTASEGDTEREAAEQAVATRILTALDEVSSLDQDRIVRALLAVIQAGLRTNYFQTDRPGTDPVAGGAPKPYVSLKLDPARIPGLPAPRPMFEIWVYGPRVEGVHLRFGKVARGGLRWSDRREDFRTEVLGLVKAQTVKNAVIVPTGSKGGFYPKQLPDPAEGRDAWLAEGVAAYTLFVSGLLDLTDNRIGGEVVPPPAVVRHDGDDTYLVVAADKGTATFSDIANGIAQDYGYWLDDAFASGGSAGYDHKAMGITARGAWESVKRHFREMGVDTQAQDFTVVGVGDMSGDVFGNGMLLSEHIRLVVAFDHRQVFVDPDPDPAASFAERRRLFELPRSSWADYDRSLISEGGGVFDRSAKSVPVSPQMAGALGIEEDVATMTPAELIHAALLAPLDLFWNGGIGTYVKASTESDADVGDRANDAVRVDGKALRVKVIGEGGNLGLTQLGRIEAARHGVRVNTDAIDNSAGVDTSDHEVNIKIMLTGLVRDGVLSLEQRNELLHAMTDEVAHAVLRDNYEQNVLLGNARAQQAEMLPVHQRLIHRLEERKELDRALEFLPSDAAIARRAEARQGLTSPEFCVLVAYSKLALKADLLPSGLPDDPWFQETLLGYFPEQIRTRYASQLTTHPLRREIITNAVVNSMVNRGGITFAFRAVEETGADPEQVARAFVVCREVFGLGSYVAAVEALDNVVPTRTQTVLYLDFRRLLDRSVRWFLTTRPRHIDVAAEIERFRGPVTTNTSRLPEWLHGVERERLDQRTAELVRLGIPADLAARAASLLDAFSLLDVVDLARDLGLEVPEVAGVYFYASERFGIDAMLTRVSLLPRDDRWDALARGAMRDDLYRVLDDLTRAILRSGGAADAPGAPTAPAGGAGLAGSAAAVEPAAVVAATALADRAGSAAAVDPAARFDAWADANRDALTRAQTALQGVERLDTAGIAALSVALRTLRGVLRSGPA